MDDNRNDERMTGTRQAALRELDDRRRVTWRIFAWTSIALIVFTLAVTMWYGRPEIRFAFQPYGLVAVVVIVLLSAGACLLIDQNQNLAIQARQKIYNHDRKLGAETDADEVEIPGGYVKMVVFLAAAAILAVLVTVDY